MSRLSNILRVCGSILLPPTCGLCAAPLARGTLCPGCGRGLDLLRARPACPFCGGSPGPYLSATGHCGDCRSQRFRFDGTARVAPYCDHMSELLRRFKYRGASHLDGFLADLMCRALEQTTWAGSIEAFVPVPSHWMRRICGGGCPAEALAAEVSRRRGRPCLRLLRRARFRRHQVGLSFRGRRENVTGAFAMRPGVRLTGATVCVIDDVMTSGATLNEVAAVLKNAGADKVCNLIAARAARQDAVWGRA